MSEPRPKHDTGIGIHGCSDCHYKPADFMGTIAQFKERGISWKLLFVCDEGKADWARHLVDNDIMPVLRIWPMFAPGLKFDIAHLEAYRDAGVQWMVAGNELNLTYEWEGPFPPGRENAYQVAESYAKRADVIRSRGMWPLTPPPSLGGNINHRKWFRYFMERIAQLGNPMDILYPGGIGLHCRSAGNPLDAKYTWYDCSADEWRWFDLVVNEFCGRSLPMMNTEAFCEPDWLPRLPDGTYDWELWRARNLEQFQWFNPSYDGYKYPDYVLCNCFWLWKATGFLQAWDEDGLIDNNAYARQTGRGLVTHLWESMKGYVDWERGDGEPEPPPPPPPPPPSTEFTIFDACERHGIELIDDRAVCGQYAKPAKIVKRLPREPHGIVVHYTGSDLATQTAESIAEYHCRSKLLGGRGYNSIAYHFLIDFQAGAHFTAPIRWITTHTGRGIVNRESIAISVMGLDATPAQVATVRGLIAALQEWKGRGDPVRTYVVPHCYVNDTPCPGPLRNKLMDGWQF